MNEDKLVEGTVAAGVIGIGCAAILLQLSLIAAVIFAIIKVVLHFT